MGFVAGDHLIHNTLLTHIGQSPACRHPFHYIQHTNRWAKHIEEITSRLLVQQMRRVPTQTACLLPSKVTKRQQAKAHRPLLHCWLQPNIETCSTTSLQAWPLSCCWSLTWTPGRQHQHGPHARHHGQHHCSTPQDHHLILQPCCPAPAPLASDSQSAEPVPYSAHSKHSQSSSAIITCQQHTWHAVTQAPTHPPPDVTKPGTDTLPCLATTSLSGPQSILVTPDTEKYASLARGPAAVCSVLPCDQNPAGSLISSSCQWAAQLQECHSQAPETASAESVECWGVALLCPPTPLPVELPAAAARPLQVLPQLPCCA